MPPTGTLLCVGGWLVLRSLRRRRMPQFSAYARLRYTTPWQAGSIYLNSQRPYSRKRATSRLLCQKQALHIFTRRRRTSRSQRNADCTNSWRPLWEVLGGFGKVWEFLGALPPITATLCVAAKRRKTAAALCVCGRALPGVSLAGAERQPAAAGFARFPILPKPSQIFPILSRGTQAFALQRHIVCRQLQR